MEGRVFAAEPVILSMNSIYHQHEFQTPSTYFEISLHVLLDNLFHYEIIIILSNSRQLVLTYYSTEKVPDTPIS